MTVLLGSFATMIQAGVPIYRALHNLGQQTEHLDSALLCRALVSDLGNGLSLSRAAARHPRTFSAMQVGLLRVGETTGKLDEILKRLAGFEEKSQALRLKLRAALTYPAMILLFCLLGLALAPPLVLEPHFNLIRDLKVPVPWPTAVLIGFSAWMRSPWPYLFVLSAGILGHRYGLPYLARKDVRLRVTQRALRVPRLGPLVRSVLVSRFARALAIQLEAGVPVHEALFLAGRVADNPLLERVADSLVKAMLGGRSLSKALRASKFFSPMFVSVVLIGEETGNVAELVDWLAESGEDDLDQALDTLSALLEPLVMALMGLLAGAMVIATLLPLARALDTL
jgi:type IV pilus assembly protein PilC